MKKFFLKVIKKELLEVAKTICRATKITIEDEIEEIKVNFRCIIPSEEVIVTVTKDGYVKRTSVRSYTCF